MRYTGLDLRRSFSSISLLDTVLPPFRLMCLLCSVRLHFLPVYSRSIQRSGPWLEPPRLIDSSGSPRR